MIYQLSDKVLTLVLSQLTTKRELYQCALVNSAFFRTVIPILYNYPTEPLSKWDESSVILPILNSLLLSPQLGQSIRRLEFGCHETIETIVSVLRCTPLINHITLKSIRPEPNELSVTLQQILALCPCLETLYLHDLAGKNNTTDQDIVKDTNLSNLRTLDMSYCSDFSGHAFELLFATCSSSLTRLTLTLHSDWSIFEQFSQLTYLELTHCTIDTLFIRHCSFRLLTHCRLVSCHVESDLLVSFFQTHSRLNHLTLNHCQLDDSVIAGIAHSLPHLTHLDLSYNAHILHPQGIRHLIKTGLGLCSVYLDECYLPIQDFPEVQPSEDGYIWRLFKGDIDRIRLDVMELTDVLLIEWKKQWISEETASWGLTG